MASEGQGSGMSTIDDARPTDGQQPDQPAPGWPPGPTRNEAATVGFAVALSGAIVSLLPVVTAVSLVLCPVGLVLSVIGLRLAVGRRTGQTLAWVGLFAAVI